MARLVDMTGRRFGRLLVIGRGKNNLDKHVMWLCVCDCGKRKLVRAQSLRRGETQSCGCYHRELCQFQRDGLRNNGFSEVAGVHAGDEESPSVPHVAGGLTSASSEEQARPHHDYSGLVTLAAREASSLRLVFTAMLK